MTCTELEFLTADICLEMRIRLNLPQPIQLWVERVHRQGDDLTPTCHMPRSRKLKLITCDSQLGYLRAGIRTPFINVNVLKAHILTICNKIIICFFGYFNNTSTL